MKKILLALVFLCSASYAQQATLNTPVVRPPEDNLKVASLVIQVSVQDSGGNEIRRFNMSIPDSTHPGATVLGYITATHFTVRLGETGTDARKANFRALGYFADQGYLPGVTLVP